MHSHEVISTLNDLIETCRDVQYDFRFCAKKASSSQLATLFFRRADGWRQAAADLQRQVVALGGKPVSGGSAKGALRRRWAALRSALPTYDDLAVLKESERSLELAVRRYREALKKPLTEPLRSLVERQYQGAKHNYQHVYSLREGMHRRKLTSHERSQYEQLDRHPQ